MDTATAVALLVLAVGAWTMPAVARAVGLPVAVAEIGYGVLVGRSGLGWLGEGHDPVGFIAHLGFALFLFVAALELDVAGLVRGGVRAVVAPLVLVAAVQATGAWLAVRLGGPAWLGLATGVISVPLAAAVLRELGAMSSPLGRQVMLLAGVGEVASIAWIAVFDVGSDAAGLGGALLGLGRALVPVAATLGAAVALRSLLWWYPGLVDGLIRRDDPQELGVRAGLALLFAGVVAAAVGGIEPVLGAFFAGLVVAYVFRDRHVLEHKLAGLAYGFFVPAFFVDVGARLDVTVGQLLGDAGFVGAIVLVMLASRVPAFVALAAQGVPARHAAAAGLLLAAPLTLQIAVARLAAEVGAFDAGVEGAVVVAAIAAGVVLPAAARALMR